MIRRRRAVALCSRRLFYCHACRLRDPAAIVVYWIANRLAIIAKFDDIEFRCAVKTCVIHNPLSYIRLARLANAITPGSVYLRAMSAPIKNRRFSFRHRNRDFRCRDSVVSARIGGTPLEEHYEYTRARRCLRDRKHRRRPALDNATRKGGGAGERDGGARVIPSRVQCYSCR